MFELDPAFRTTFGFSKDADANDPVVYKNAKFLAHGQKFLSMIEKAVDCLGPDLEPLETELYDLGRRHVLMNALPEYWPTVGEALFHMLENVLGDAFTDEVRKAWTVVYHFMAYNMIQGLLNELAKRSP